MLRQDVFVYKMWALKYKMRYKLYMTGENTGGFPWIIILTTDVQVNVDTFWGYLWDAWTTDTAAGEVSPTHCHATVVQTSELETSEVDYAGVSLTPQMVQ